MKRAGHLFERIVERENLRHAFHRAARGKRDRSDARIFAGDLENNLQEIARQLLAGTFPLGRFHQFVIRDPKQRIITAPCFPERVLHHAIMRVCEPVFERWLIDDTFACRTGKGRDAALLRAKQFAGRFPAFLKLDIRKYFDSISHEVLLDRLTRLFKDRRLLHLFERIITSFRSDAGRGLPIGSLVSQHFANFYLGWGDRFVKETLRVRGYVRYMDDMSLWSDSPSRMKAMLAVYKEFFQVELQLDLKPEPYINRTAHGMDFLGCRVFRGHITLNRRSKVRYRRKLKTLEAEYNTGELSAAELQQRADSLTAFTQTAGVSSWQFRRRVLQQLAVDGR